MDLKPLKIILIGDFNFSYNAHHATNLSIEHSSELLEQKVDYYWVRIHEAVNLKPSSFKKYDGIWLVPGPFENSFFLHSVFSLIFDTQLPVFITGTGFKPFIEFVIERFQLNPMKEKCVSSNLFTTPNQFEKVSVYPQSKTLKKMYGKGIREELTNARFSIYPHIFTALKEKAIDIEATNQFGEAEIVSLTTRPFCVASMSLPQICSTQNHPHPLITGYLNYLVQRNKD